MKHAVPAAIGAVTALIASVSGAAAYAAGDHRPPTTPALSCPAPYQLAEVHVYGQRIEHGLDGHGPSQVIVQNDPAAVPPDNRYVVSLACVRPLTDAERNAAFYGLSTAPVSYPFVLGGAG